MGLSQGAPSCSLPIAADHELHSHHPTLAKLPLQAAKANCHCPVAKALVGPHSCGPQQAGDLQLVVLDDEIESLSLVRRGNTPGRFKHANGLLQTTHGCGDLLFSSHTTFALVGVMSYQEYGTINAVKVRPPIRTA